MPAPHEHVRPLLEDSCALLAILDAGEKRQGLSDLRLVEDPESFTRVAVLAKELEAGLLAPLFDDPELRRCVREYLIF